MDIYIMGIIISIIVLISIIMLGEQTGRKRIQSILENKGYRVVMVKAINQLGRHHSRCMKPNIMIEIIPYTQTVALWIPALLQKE